jgi:hypothetical protein
MFVEQERSTGESSSPLSQEVIARHVLSYVSPGHWWFVATVCSLWRDLYKQLPVVEVQVSSYNGNMLYSYSKTCTPQMTLYSAVCASAWRVRLAQSSINCTAKQFQTAAGKYATITALVAAHDLGMQYTAAVMKGCARCNKLAVMQFLRAEGCPWHHLVCHTVAVRGFFEMLRWAREHGCDLSCGPNILQSVAKSGNVEMAAWVCQQPDVECCKEAVFDAASHGHTAMCAYLHDAKHTPWHFSSMLCCCTRGSLWHSALAARTWLPLQSGHIRAPSCKRRQC